MYLATEIIRDLKKEAKRKQVVICILVTVIALLLTIMVVERALWYDSLVLVNTDENNASYVSEEEGSIYIFNQETASWHKHEQKK